MDFEGTLLCGIFMVEYAWKMFSLRHFGIKLNPDWR
jgi:hypothetical protein